MAIQLGAAQPLNRRKPDTAREGVVAKETETRTGRCATHGTVEAVREIPKLGFPYIYFAIARSRARRRPFLCPDCGEPVNS
jgi:hypothetical protein